MSKFTNTSQARLVLLPTFILDAGQSRDATEIEIKAMNRQIVEGLAKDGKLSVEGLSDTDTSADKAAADKAAADKAAADKKSGGGMPTPK